MTISAEVTHARNSREGWEEKTGQREVEFNPSEEYFDADTTEVHNVMDPGSVKTNMDVWEEEMGYDKPKGVYRGPVMSPYHMELDHRPRWRNEYQHGYPSSTGEYGQVALSQEIEVSSDKIMTGSTEFTVQVPVLADSLDVHTMEIARESLSDRIENVRHFFVVPRERAGRRRIALAERNPAGEWVYNEVSSWRRWSYSDTDQMVEMIEDELDFDEEEYALWHTTDEYFDWLTTTIGLSLDQILGPLVTIPSAINSFRHEMLEDTDKFQFVSGNEELNPTYQGYVGVESFQTDVRPTSDFFSSLHIYEGEINRESVEFGWNRSKITAESTANDLRDREVNPVATVPIRPEDYYGNRPYVDVNMFFESDKTYTFVYNLLTGGDAPIIFTTPDDNFGDFGVHYQTTNVETVRQSAPAYSPFKTDFPDTSISKTSALTMYPQAPQIVHPGEYDDTNSYYRSTVLSHIPNIYQSNTDIIMSDYEEKDMSLATSLIFTEGVGDNYMFGKEVEFEKGDIMQFHGKTNMLELVEGEEDYTGRLSLYLPFISEGLPPISLSVYTDLGNPSYEMRYPEEDPYIHPDANGEEGEETNVWARESENVVPWVYNDFILYSDTGEWDFYHEVIEEKDEFNVVWQMRFLESAKLTFLVDASGEFDRQYNNEDLTWWQGANAIHYSPEVFGETPGMIDSHMRMWDEMYYGPDNEEYEVQPEDLPVVLGENETWEGTFTPYFYNFHSVSHVTDGPWHQEIQYGPGTEVYTHAFDVSEYYSDVSYQMVDEENRVIWVNMTDGDGGVNDRGYLRQIRDGFISGVNRFTDGITDVPGMIRDGFSAMWEGIKEGFRILQATLLSFIGTLWELIQDIGSMLARIFERIVFIGGLLMFAICVKMFSKLIAITDLRGKMGVDN